MAHELLETYTQQYIEAQRVPEVTFAWQGGEPTLMGLSFFRLAVELQGRYRRPGMQIHNTLQTNGTLLDYDARAQRDQTGHLIAWNRTWAEPWSRHLV